MTAIGTVIRVLRDPVVRAIVIPLVESLVAWVQGGRRPGWLDGALRDVPSIDGAVQALEAAKDRRGRR
jgi:hypothetical protein